MGFDGCRCSQESSELCRSILKAAPRAVSAAERLSSLDAVSTGAAELDALLSGGVRFGEVTEVCGPAGSLKSQLCIAIAVNGALSGCNVRWIQTHADNIARRIRRYCVSLCSAVAKEASDDALRALGKFAMYSCPTIADVCGVVHELSLLEAEPTVVVLDSIHAVASVCGRSNNQKNLSDQGAALVASVGRQLRVLSRTGKTCVLVTNGVSSFGGSGHLRPALGRVWAGASDVTLGMSPPPARLDTIHQSTATESFVVHPSKTAVHVAILRSPRQRSFSVSYAGEDPLSETDFQVWSTSLLELDFRGQFAPFHCSGKREAAPHEERDWMSLAPLASVAARYRCPTVSDEGVPIGFRVSQSARSISHAPPPAWSIGDGEDASEPLVVMHPITTTSSSSSSS
jgi:RecA/RadA recombinase